MSLPYNWSPPVKIGDIRMNDEQRVDTDPRVGNNTFADIKKEPLSGADAERLGIGSNPNLGRETGDETSRGTQADLDIDQEVVVKAD